MDKKKILTIKIIIFVLIILIISLVSIYLVDYFNNDSVDWFFNQHFALGIALIFIGAIAFCLPFFTRTRYGDNKGDNTMVIVAILLVLCGIVSIPLTFLWFNA